MTRRSLLAALPFASRLKPPAPLPTNPLCLTATAARILGNSPYAHEATLSRAQLAQALQSFRREATAIERMVPKLPNL